MFGENGEVVEECQCSFAWVEPRSDLGYYANGESIGER